MRVQKEFQTSGSRLDNFLNKGTPSSDVVSDSAGVKAAIDGPFSSPVETAKGAVNDAKQAADKAAPGKGGLLGLFNKATPKADDAKGVVGNAADAAKDALPGNPGQVAGKAKEAAGKVADAAPSKGGGFFSFFNQAPKPSQVKGAASNAASSAKDALPNSAPSPSQVASGAKDAADKVSDAAPSKGFLGGILNDAPDAGGVKGAVGDAASSAKDALPNSAPSPSQVASGAKDAADKVADAAPSKGGFLGGLLNNAPDAGDVRGAVGDAASSAKDALPNSAPSPSQVASGAKDTADKVADAAPSKGGFLGGLFNNAPGAGDVKGAVGDAKDAAKDALPNSANPSQVASGAKDAADKVADAAPSKGGFLGGLFNNAPDAGDVKGAVGDAKDALPNSANPSQVASNAKDAADSVADAAPNGVVSGAKDAAQNVANAAPGDVVTGAKDAARSVANAAPSSPGEAVDGAKQGLRDASLTPSSPREALASAKDATESAKQGAKDVVGSAQDEAEVVGSGNKTPSGSGFFSQFLGDAKSTAQDVKGSAQAATDDAKDALPTGGDVKDAVQEAAPNNNKPGGGIFGSLLGGPTPEPAQPVSNQLEAPQPSSLEEDVPKGAEKLPPQPYPEKESAVPADRSGADSAGSKFGETVEDTANGRGILDSFGGPPSGKSQEQKKDELVEQSKQPNPTKNFLGNFFSSKDGGNPFSNILDGSSSIATNEVGSVAALPAPQPSDVDEQGNLPQKAPGDEIKLPPQPKPEGPAPEQLGKDSAGGKTGSTKSGGGILDFFGGSSAQPTDPLQKPVSLTASNFGNVIATTAEVEAPQPSSLEESFPESAPGKEIVPDEQPAPEPASKKLPQDSAGGQTQDTKSGGGILDFFGGSTGKDSSQKAADNVQKASASLAPSSEIGQIAEGAPEAVAEAVNENKPDGGKATLIGLAFTIALEILIFTVQPTGKEGKKAAH